MPVSDTTILAGLRKHARARSESSAVAAVHVAGVDDWAWRKGSNYGTIIVDLERREVVDVLVDRSAATTASWFKDHPDVEVVSRDRAGLYAEAAREGAPQARQVADRFHLLQNFRETIERQLGGYEAPIPESRQSDDSQAGFRFWRSRIVPLTPSCRRAWCAVSAELSGNSYSTRSGLFLKGAVPSGRSPTSSVFVADGSKGGSVASICRTATQ
jgi:hypothetical protein